MAILQPYIQSKLFINIVTPLAATCLANDDDQTKNISFNFFRLILKSDIVVLMTLELLKKYFKIITEPTIRDMTVAHAAQDIHILNQNMNTQSSIIFIIEDRIITIIAIFACQTDLIILLFHILKHKKTIHISNIEKYLCHKFRISGVAQKNQSKGLVNNNHNIIKIIANDMLLV